MTRRMKLIMKCHMHRILLFVCIVSMLAMSCALADSASDALGYIQARLAENCPIASYESENPTLANAAYTVDNAYAAIALTELGDTEGAAQILDALCKAVAKDSQYESRLRNAYMEGDCSDVPGYWNEQEQFWSQDAVQVGTGAESTAVAAVAMLRYNAKNPTQKYVDCAEEVLGWFMDNCMTENGFTAGYEGWDGDNRSTYYTYKSTTDNMLLYAAYSMLFAATGNEDYRKAAENAQSFVTKMYSEGDHRFFEGTDAEGRLNASIVVMKAQAMAMLTMNNNGGMKYLYKCETDEGGYPYSNATKEGYWTVGTGMASVAFAENGDTYIAAAALAAMEACQLATGAFPEASIESLFTGEDGWYLTDDSSLAATAWYLLAANGINPFRI